MIEFLKQLTNPESIIQYGGLALLLFVVFAETGLLIGFFLPGDSLIFISGMFCSSHNELLKANLFVLIFLLSLAAIAGNAIGYWFGNKVGPPLFNRKDSLIFKKKYLEETQAYYTLYGAATIIIARFIPVVRTFAPILAGVGKMPYRTFLRYNMIGGTLWGAGITLLGYFLGKTIPGIDHYLYPIIALIIFISALPIIIQWWKAKKQS